MWARRAGGGRSSVARAAAFRCAPSPIEFLDLLKGLDRVSTRERSVSDRYDTLRPQSLALRMPTASLGHAPYPLRFLDGFRLQRPQSGVGVENQVFVDRLLPFFLQCAPHLAECPEAERRMRGMAIRNLE